MDGRSWRLQRPAVLVLGLPAGPDHPWPAEITPRILDRFTENKDPIRLVRVEPIVVEVSADTAFENGAFRHPLRFGRLRPDLDPASLAG